jgi:hypothetical protein
MILLLSALPAWGGERATAILSFAQISPTTYHYKMTLNNTGTTNVGTFWFAWVPGEDFMPTSPTNISSPPSWTSQITLAGPGDGYAILWTAGQPLAPGGSLSGFEFDSTTTPQQMAGPSDFFDHPPVLESFVYAGAPFADPGYEFVVSTALQFVPITPCRIADTRNPNGPFGGPELAAGSARSFTIPNTGCGVPSTAAAYSLNVTVVPDAQLGYLTIWPSGGTPPLVSTLNSDGRVKANAAIVPAGNSGAVSVFVTDSTHVVLDINGYFEPGGSSGSDLQFYPLTPCRIADTREGSGPFGAPILSGGAAGRTFPITSSACNVPATARAYSLNFTAVPHGRLGFLTVWPAGQSQPLVSTLNASTGAVTANAAIVPAGSGGGIQVFASDDTDLVIDINGYLAPPTSGGLSLYNLTPCRVVDTRNPQGSPPFNGSIVVNVGSSGCGAAVNAQAHVLNATVVPPGPLGYVTLWPDGHAEPLVSTLNALDGAITSNMAIVPTTNGSIDAFAANPTQLVLDISGYFAP